MIKLAAPSSLTLTQPIIAMETKPKASFIPKSPAKKPEVIQSVKPVVVQSVQPVKSAKALEPDDTRNELEFEKASNLKPSKPIQGPSKESLLRHAQDDDFVDMTSNDPKMSAEELQKLSSAYGY
jgi:hypothetical protein